jgi:hypothetical protein
MNIVAGRSSNGNKCLCHWNVFNDIVGRDNQDMLMAGRVAFGLGIEDGWIAPINQCNLNLNQQ